MAEFLTDFNSGWIDPDLWEILKDFFAAAGQEIIQETLADLIPGGSAFTLGPEAYASFQQGNLLEGIMTSIEIFFDEADVVLPALKIGSVAIASYDKYKLLTRVYRNFKKLKQGGQEVVLKTYETLRQHLAGGPGAIMRKWKYDGGQQSILEGIPNRSQFYNDLKNRFNAVQAFTYNGNPVLKLYTIPMSSSELYVTSYTNSSTLDPATGQPYPLTIKFYIKAPLGSTSPGTNPNSAPHWNQLFIIRLR